MSLIEVSIILMVIASLTAAIAPSASTYLNGARNTKAKEDVEAIGSAIAQVLRDTGVLCLSLNGSSCANSATGRVELLVSGTVVGNNEPVVVSSVYVAPASTTSAVNMNWGGGTNEVADARRDLMDRQLAANSAGYAAATFTGGGGPKAGIGWRGAYLTGPIDVDPWGYSYQANTVFLTVASDAADGTGSGQRRGGWSNNVLVISAGSNGVIQTAFGAAGASGGGDDVVYVLQGTSH